MKAQFIKMYPENPDQRKIRKILEVFRSGGVVIFPTDTIYGLGCIMTDPKAVEKVCRIKGIDPAKSQLSMICKDISQVSEFVKGLDTPIYKSLKRNLPGPFTIIFKVNHQLPKKLKNRKKTIGVRIPDNNIALELVTQLGTPIFTTSVKDEDEVVEYTTDPEFIYEKFSDKVDLIINAGFGKNIPSTVVDVTSGNFELIRQGLGDFESLF